MGSLATQGGGANALAAYGGVNPWAEAARGVADGAYLKFNGNTGEITYGSDDEELLAGSRLITDMTSLALGWTCWSDSQVLEEILVPVVDGRPPLEHELTEHGPYEDDDDGWRESASISAVIASYGEDDADKAVGTPLLFKTSTGGAVRSVKKLSAAYGRVFMQHPGELPVVELIVDSYIPKQKKHGRKFSLTFKIVAWVSEAEMESLSHADADADGDYEPEPAAKPVRNQPALPAPAPVEEEEEVAPAPRRRAAPAPVEEEEEVAPAPRRRAAPAPVEEEEEVAPAPRRRTAPEPVEEEEEVAPAPRRRAAPEPAEEDEPAPAPRGRAAAPAAEEEEELEAPAPRGRSAGRGAPPASARLRRFD